MYLTKGTVYRFSCIINKSIQINYNNNTNIYQLVFQVETGILIAEDDSVRLLSQIMEELNYKKLYKAYSTKGRNPDVESKDLFKILIYTYMNDIYSSRKIETACKRDINFIWLLQRQNAPDHCAIARFRTERLKDGIIDNLFDQLVTKLSEIDEINYKNIFIDGTKIGANANKYTFVWRKATNKFEAKLQIKIKTLIESINKEFETTYDFDDSKITINELEEIKVFLDDKKLEAKINFVNGKGKRKTQVQKFIENIE